MTDQVERDYLLGTHDAEIERLGLQHRVWRAFACEAWRRAGITVGSRVLDVGAGPGYAAVDLAEIVGPAGAVIAIERSARFLAHARQMCALRGLVNVDLREQDLATDPLAVRDCDAAWCRWVAAFLESPRALVSGIVAALRPGGRAVFHEYWDYRSWRVAPRREVFEGFVSQVAETWRASGGEPEIAMNLPAMLRDAGCTIVSQTPLSFVCTPSDFAWRWCAAFVEPGLSGIVELGHRDRAWAERVRAEFIAAEADPHTVMTTPVVMEIIAERRA